MKKVELLAPAGDVASLKLAIKAGADAVYLGLKNGFNARMKANNIDIDNLEEWVNYAHIFNVRIYITFNTLVNDDEFDTVLNLIFECFKKGVDAFIIQDLGLVTFLRKNYPTIPIHMSTQAGINNTYGAYFYEKLGVKRLILSRECDFDEIKRIKDSVNTEIEAFVHGALCVSFSGNCYISSFAGGNSGNRGQCLQFCRQPYTLLSKKSIHAKNLNEDKYLLSPKDQCFLSELSRLVEIGVDSIKIEGRMKRPEYVAQVVSSYRKALNAIYENKPLKESEIKVELNNLKKMFNRGDFTLGYNNGNGLIIYKDVQNHIGLYVGNVVSIENNIATCTSNQILNTGDGFKFLRDNEFVGSGEFFKRLDINKYLIKCNGDIKDGDSLHITTDANLIDNISKLDRRYNVKSILSFEGSNISLEVEYNGNQVFNHTYYNVVSEAKNAPVSADRIIDEISKITDKYKNNVIIKGDTNNIFIRVFHIKEIKRDIISNLDSYFLNKYTKHLSVKDYSFNEENIKDNDSHKRYIQVRSLEQLDDELVSMIDNVIYFPNEYNYKDSKVFTKAIKHSYLFIPPNLNEKDIDVLDEIIPLYEGLSISNATGIELAKKHKKKIIANYLCNIFNRETADLYGSIGEYVYSMELNIDQIKELYIKSIKKSLSYIFTFGDVPVMNFKHCPVKNLLNCNCENCKYTDGLKYLDNLGNKFEIRRYKIHNCYFELYNSAPLMYNSNNTFNEFFNFMTFSKDEIKNVLHKYNNGEKVELKNFTYGHFNKGVK